MFLRRMINLSTVHSVYTKHPHMSVAHIAIMRFMVFAYEQVDPQLPTYQYPDFLEQFTCDLLVWH